MKLDLLDLMGSLGGTARTRDVLASGLHPRDLYRARDAGDIVEVSRGVYRLAEEPLTEPDLVVVAMRAPRALFCTLTALHLHGITEAVPHAVHVALPQGRHAPTLGHPPLEVYHFSAASFIAGQEMRVIDGVEMHVTSPAKSVADAFKFRTRVGLDTAIDALRQAITRRIATPAEIDDMARVCRVQRVMRPYLEALA